MPEVAAASAFLKRTLIGKTVILWAPGEEFPRTAVGEKRAVIRFETSLPGVTFTANGLLIQMGFSPYWQRDEQPNLDPHLRYVEFAEFSKRHQIGAWRTATDWMVRLDAEAVEREVP